MKKLVTLSNADVKNAILTGEIENLYFVCTNWALDFVLNCGPISVVNIEELTVLLKSDDFIFFRVEEA